jgi:hypothetical protein
LGCELIELVKKAYREMARGEVSTGGGKSVEGNECLGDIGVDPENEDLRVENLEVDSLRAFRE